MSKKFEHPAIAMERRFKDAARKGTVQEQRFMRPLDGGARHFSRVMGEGMPLPETSEGWRTLLSKDWERAQYLKLYRLYLRSPEWQAKRTLAIQRDKCCRMCGSKDFLAVHHINYFTVGNEDISSLTTVCDDCHKDHHHESPFPY
jgi:hypothetical protein